jgi:HK97 family phage prohead protease
MDLKYIDRPFEVKAVDDAGIFTGYGSVFGNVDSYQEIVAPGAFVESLAAWKDAGKLPPVLWQHRSGEPVGPYLELREDSHGLWAKGQLLVDDVVRAKEARALMKAKAVNGLSIGFVTREDSYDKVTGIRTLKKIDLWEISIVTFPANPAAQISNVKSAVEALETLAEAERYLRDAGGFSKAAALAFIARVKSMQNRSDSDELGELKRRLTALRTTIV